MSKREEKLTLGQIMARNLKGETFEKYTMRFIEENYSREMQKYEEFNKKKIAREFKLLFGSELNLMNHEENNSCDDIDDFETSKESEII